MPRRRVWAREQNLSRRVFATCLSCMTDVLLCSCVLGVLNFLLTSEEGRTLARAIATSDGVSLKKERNKSLTRGHVEDIESALRIQPYGGQRYEGVVFGKRLATSRDLHLYVMAVLSGALVVRTL